MNKELLEELKNLALREHFYDEDDKWINCPMHPEGCSNDLAPNRCTCGADEHNAKVYDIYNELINGE